MTTRSTAAPPTAQTAKKTGRVLLQPPLPPLFSSSYVVDFGYVTRGQARTRKFKMVNPTPETVTMRFDKPLLESWGFKVSPEAVSKLPTDGSVEVALTLEANKSSVQAGPIELTLPIAIKNGPPILLTIKAHVQVPDLKLSQEVLDFGTVQTGLARVVTVQLHNHNQVPCEWAVKRPAEELKCRDWGFFSVEPSEGLLEPDQKLNVAVSFAAPPSMLALCSPCHPSCAVHLHASAGTGGPLRSVLPH